MTKTKKLPAGFDPKKPNRRIGHVVPKWTLGLSGEEFLAVDSQKVANIGRVVYLGREIDSGDVLKKVKETHQLSVSDSEAIRRIDRFITLTGGFKIGDLIRCEVGEDLLLTRVRELSRVSAPHPLP